MSYTIDFTWNGLDISAEIEEYDRGTRWDPPSGGGCEDFTFEVDDLSEVFGHDDTLVESEGVMNMLLAAWEITETVSPTLIAKIEREWADDIMEAANEYFWNDIGGPSGLADYYYEG